MSDSDWSASGVVAVFVNGKKRPCRRASWQPRNLRAVAIRCLSDPSNLASSLNLTGAGYLPLPLVAASWDKQADSLGLAARRRIYGVLLTSEVNSDTSLTACRFQNCGCAGGQVIRFSVQAGRKHGAARSASNRWRNAASPSQIKSRNEARFSAGLVSAKANRAASGDGFMVWLACLRIDLQSSLAHPVRRRVPA